MAASRAAHEPRANTVAGARTHVTTRSHAARSSAGAQRAAARRGLRCPRGHERAQVGVGRRSPCRPGSAAAPRTAAPGLGLPRLAGGAGADQPAARCKAAAPAPPPARPGSEPCWLSSCIIAPRSYGDGGCQRRRQARRPRRRRHAGVHLPLHLLREGGVAQQPLHGRARLPQQLQQMRRRPGRLACACCCCCCACCCCSCANAAWKGGGAPPLPPPQGGIRATSRRGGRARARRSRRSVGRRGAGRAAHLRQGERAVARGHAGGRLGGPKARPATLASPRSAVRGAAAHGLGSALVLGVVGEAVGATSSPSSELPAVAARAAAARWRTGGAAC